MPDTYIVFLLGYSTWYFASVVVIFNRVRSVYNYDIVNDMLGSTIFVLSVSKGLSFFFVTLWFVLSGGTVG